MGVWGSLGLHFGSFGDTLGSIFGALMLPWGSFWVLWGFLGLHFGGFGNTLGSIFGTLMLPWGSFWVLWGFLGLHFGGSGGPMGAFGNPGGRPWPPVGPKVNFFQFFALILGLFWLYFEGKK